MTQRNKPLSSIRIVYRRSTTLTKIVVSAAVVLSMAALLTLHGAIDATRQRAEELRIQAIALEQANSRLEQYIAQQGTVQEVIRIAQEKLGMVQPDSIVIQPEYPEYMEEAE